MDAIAGADEELRFRIDDPVELTLEASVTWTADGKVGWKILEIGGNRERGQTQTIRLKLMPVWADATTGEQVSPLIAGTLPLEPWDESGTATDEPPQDEPLLGVLSS